MKSRSFTTGLAVLLLLTGCGEVDRGSGGSIPTVPSGSSNPIVAATTSSPIVPSVGHDQVSVEATDIILLESFPVQARLVVRGSLPTPCHEAVWEVDDVGPAIDVELWSEPDPEDDCIQVIEPFEISIPLGSFESASRPVLLNGDEIGRLTIGSEPDSGDVSLVGAGWSFGMCGGYCTADLAVERDGLVLTGSGHMGEEPLFVNRGVLTRAARERIDAAVRNLNDLTLDPVYGCPDCADGGAAYLVLARQGAISRHDMEFGRPPEVLVELRELASSMIGPLETCESNDLVAVADDCTPWPGR